MLFCAEGTAHSCHGNSQLDFISMAGLLINKLDPKNNNRYVHRSLVKGEFEQVEVYTNMVETKYKAPGLEAWDVVIVVLYFLIVLGVGLFVSINFLFLLSFWGRAERQTCGSVSCVFSCVALC